ncbi:MAG TPA: MBL fold metallo-hydrolase [Terriglobia bacterium]|nr:MBL fold metallo-hydrolase [Terriglobia bacterium]
MLMRVRFWGVRGSTPTPQVENMGFGGNTSCTEIRTDSDEILIFDGGTGIRLLGKALEKEFGKQPIRGHIFFSHFHLDHIQGIPFFRPLYDAKNHFTFYFAGRPNANLVKDALAGMMANPYFPMDMSKLPCPRKYVDLVEGKFKVADTEILVLPLNHPQGCVGYRITQNGKSISYCTDVEHGPEWNDRNIQTLAMDTDLFIVDSQYTPEELPGHSGWGHSSWKQAIDTGNAARAKKVVLYHHDPYHEDAALEEILQKAKQHHPNVIAAREGLEVTI